MYPALPSDAPTAGLPGACAHYGQLYGALYPGFDQQHRGAGSSGLSMLKVAQTSHETSDPAIGQIVFRTVTRSEMTHSSVDCGDGRRTLSGRRDTFYLAPADAVADWRGEGNHEVMLLAAPTAFVRGLLDDDPSADGPDPLVPLYGRELMDERLTALMARIWTESARAGAGARLTVDGLFMMLLGTLADIAADGPRPDSTTTAAPLDDVRLNQVIDHIDATLDGPIGVEDLAAIACMSPFHFSRRFGNATGTSPHRFVLQRRIEASTRLLAETDMPIGLVALDCGFSSQSHFTTTFKSRMGLTPGRYRAMHGATPS
ncbi:MAG: AraC family transcriptional regulator [Pseudomonadota bacterium]